MSDIKGAALLLKHVNEAPPLNVRVGLKWY